jgi:hypothetical protein
MSTTLLLCIQFEHLSYIRQFVAFSWTQSYDLWKIRSLKGRIDNIPAFSSGFLLTLVAPLILSRNCKVYGIYMYIRNEKRLHKDDHVLY